MIETAIIDRLSEDSRLESMELGNEEAMDIGDMLEVDRLQDADERQDAQGSPTSYLSQDMAEDAEIHARETLLDQALLLEEASHTQDLNDPLLLHEQELEAGRQARVQYATSEGQEREEEEWYYPDNC